MLEAMLSLSAQQFHTKTLERKAWIDLQLVQHIGLSAWSNDDFVNDGYPRSSVTEFRGVFNARLISSYVGFFADMGIGVLPAPKMGSLDPSRIPAPHTGTRYYLREIVAEKGNGRTSAQFRMTGGLFGRIPAGERLSVQPYFGVGFMTMPMRRYDVILKEDGTNTQYNTRFVWNAEGIDDDTSATLGYLTGRLNFNCKLAEKLNLLLGVEYTHFFSAPIFYARYTNAFNANIERRIEVTGNRMNMLGLSVGLSF